MLKNNKLSKHRICKPVKRKLEDLSTNRPVKRINFTSDEWKRCGEGFESDEVRRVDEKKKVIPSLDAFSIKSSFDSLPDKSTRKSESPVAEILWDSSDSEDDNKLLCNSVADSSRILNTEKKSLPPKPEVHQRKNIKKHVKNVKYVNQKKKLKQSWTEVEKSEDIVISSSDSECEKSSLEICKPDQSDFLSEIDDTEEFYSPLLKKEKDSNPEKQNSSCGNSPIIQSCQSSQSTNSTSPSTGLKASDWIKNVQWETTPVKAKVSDDAELDSAKKKKLKFKKGGFAEQLFRLQNREKSSVRMWSHERDETSSSSSTSSKSISLRVDRCEVLFSLQLAFCSVINSKLSSDKGDNCREVYVLFTKQLMEQLQIQVGTTVRINPPWQQLDGLYGYPSILLCANYTRVISQPDCASPPCVVENKVRHTHLHWNCPCLTDLLMNQIHCPAQEFPVMPSTLKYHQSGSTDVKAVHTSFHTVTASQRCVKSTSLLESIETAGPHSLRHLSFTATVHRVFCHHDNQTKRFSLLVQDDHGTVAVVAVPGSHGNQDMWKLEGRTACFSGLLVVRRTNRDKDPSLFSVIDEVWSVTNTTQESQENESSEEKTSLQTHTNPTPPGFCYSLRSEDEFFSVDTYHEVSPCYRNTQFSTLKSLTECSHLTRKSFLAKVIFSYMLKEYAATNSKFPVEGKQLLYLTDKSIQDESCTYIVLTVGDSSCVMESLKKKKKLFFFRDVMVEDGKCQIDRYTDIFDVQSERFIDRNFTSETLQELNCLDVRLPQISNMSTELSLVTITGCVCDVDDEASYSWDVCDHCHSNRLTRSHIELFCLKCQKPVTSPETRMKMEVFVDTGQVSSRSRLKVDLLQSTIKELLPVSQNEEGYNINSILMKEVGLLRCFIETITTQNNQMLIYAKEIET